MIALGIPVTWMLSGFFCLLGLLFCARGFLYYRQNGLARTSGRVSWRIGTIFVTAAFVLFWMGVALH
jgi:hypothetical protein